ncbi:hypothetical protein C6P42_001130 [Pichia californica]|nr:hypothetical protein C6P42_001130 [[Candida] californica]
MSNPTGAPENGNDEQRVVYSSSILFEKQPIEAMEALVIRRQQAKIINKELAEWFTAYGRLRLHYVDELKKIHKKGETLFSDASPTLQNQKLNALGLCNPLWSDTLAILNDEINLFDQSTRKMGRDMIAPLRLFTRNNDSNLAEMDELSQLATKLKETNGSIPEIYQDEWQRRAPYFFEIFENYDYQRLLLLKDVFLKYQTDVSDVLTHFKKDNENGLEHVLNFNVDDEIKRFSTDVINSNIPVENIKVSNTTDHSRTSTDGFTSSSVAGDSSNVVNNSKRHSSLLSPRRFHIKKNGEEHEQHENDISSHSKEAESSAASNTTSSKGKRHTSSTSMLSSNTILTNNNTNSDKRKEKNSMRSKFGSIFKSHKKGGKDSEFTPPSTIQEPDTSSINTETTTNSSRFRGTNNRQRNQSIASTSNNLNANNKYRQQEDIASKTEPVPTNNSSAPDYSSPKRSSYQYKESANYPSTSAEAKPLPEYPIGESQQQQQQQQQQQHTLQQQYPAQTELQSQPTQPTLQKKVSENSIYEPMRPTKRSDSLSSGNVPQFPLSASTADSYNVNSASISTTTGVSSIPPIARGMENIPESSPLVSQQPPPPPPPSSRKNVMSELATPNVSTSRLPHGNVPVPPTQRRSLSNEQQPLQPAATGTHQPESTNTAIAKNTTGGGSLMGGQIMHPALTTPGLNSSIVELFNATFKDGKLARSNAIGEVAFSYIVDASNNKLPSEIGLQIESKSNSVLPNFMVNPMFLQQKDDGSFIIADPSQISMRTVGGLKYMLNNPTPPIVITPIWKHEDKQSTIIISIKPTSELDDYLLTESLTLSNVMISVSIQGAIVSSAATKPPGSLNKEKGRVTWILPNSVVFNSSKKEERLVARFITNQKASESETGVQVRFNISNDDGAGRIDFLNTDMGIKASGVNMVEDPFGDGVNKQIDDWSEVPTLKSLVAGSYSGHS